MEDAAYQIAMSHSSIMSTTLISTETQAKQPDIAYHPDEAKWKARTARRLAEDPTLPFSPLPEGFPTQVSGPIVWEGSDWKGEEQWVYQLSEDELKEIDEGLRHFKCKVIVVATGFMVLINANLSA